MEIDTTSTMLQVLPDPVLYVRYFRQRFVEADDPFTEEVEPSAAGWYSKHCLFQAQVYIYICMYVYIYISWNLVTIHLMSLVLRAYPQTQSQHEPRFLSCWPPALPTRASARQGRCAFPQPSRRLWTTRGTGKLVYDSKDSGCVGFRLWVVGLGIEATSETAQTRRIC